MIVAIDGPAASGKGTLARRLADHFGFAYLDTGLIYRATGYAVLQSGGDPADPEKALTAAQNLDPAGFASPALRDESSGVAASKVAAIQEVRAELLEFQRNFAAHPPAPATGAVLDGRDIGTVVCPDAPVKFFITASVDVRANRRFKELQEKGQDVIYTRVLQEMKDRDARDSERSAAPLKAADDAFHLDTDNLDRDEVFTRACDYISSRM